MKKFSDFAKDDELPFDGEKVRVDNILNKEIIIERFRVRNSKYQNKGGKCATVQFTETEGGEHKIFFTGSNVVIDMLEKYESELPFATTLKKIDRYYTLS